MKIQNFKKECKDSVIAIIAKLQERSLLQYAVVRMASSLSSHNMVRAKEKSLTYLNLLAEKVAKLKWMSRDKADEAKTEDLKFTDIECVLFKDKLLAFMQPMTVLTRSWVQSCMVRKNIRAYGRFGCLCLFCHMA